MGISQRGRTPSIAVRPRSLSGRARLKRFLALFTLVVLTATAGVLVYGVLLVRSINAHLPSVASLADVRADSVTTILSSDGVPLAGFRTRYRLPVALSQISPYLVQATLATEDSRFYAHHGVDFRAVGRALLADLHAGSAYQQGASTITQQLARNLYLTQDKSFKRKIEEMLLARRIEQSYTKNEILEAYLNTVYYGNGAYGAEAASRAYFGKPARSLTLGEAALLAGLPQRPAAFSPTQHLEAALKRRSEVLARLLATGKITPAQKAQAEAQPLHILPPHLETVADWRAPYFVSYVVAQLRAKYGQEFLYSGARIVTSLNWRMQQAAEHTLRNGLHAGWGPNTGAMVAIDPRSGYVRALVGGPDFHREQFDAAIDGVRQPGSAFKPFVYVTAFDMNVCNLLTQVDDQKLVIPNKPKKWVVHNYDGVYHGPVSVLDALRHSINTVAVQVAQQIGPGTIASYAQRLGITTPLDPYLPLALGASGVRPLDICSAYTAFANGGNRYDPAFVLQITDAQGNVLYQDDPSARYQAGFLGQEALDQLNVALREVVTSGTGRAAASIPDAHGKTGTTNDHRDAWFVGYTGDLTTAVWVAHEHRGKKRVAGGRTITQTTYLPMPGETGGKLCAPIWRDFMARAVPIEQRVNLVHGIQPAQVPGPSTAQMVAMLEQEQQQAAQAQQDAQAAFDPSGWSGQDAQNQDQAAPADADSAQGAYTPSPPPAWSRNAQRVIMETTQLPVYPPPRPAQNGYVYDGDPPASSPDAQEEADRNRTLERNPGYPDNSYR